MNTRWLFDGPDHSLDEGRFVPFGLSPNVPLVTVVDCYRGEDDVIRCLRDCATSGRKRETDWKPRPASIP